MKIHIDNINIINNMTGYKPRTLEKEIIKWLDENYSVVLVGPRQASKTTLLKHIADVRDGQYLSLDDPNILESRGDVKLFARMLRSRDFYIDEAQYDEGIGKKTQISARY